jgi:hypothetical protein
LAQWLDYRRHPDARAQLPLNRAIVRFADAFIVSSEELKLQVLRERNQATPVGVVPRSAGIDVPEETSSEERAWIERGVRKPMERTDHWNRVAESYLELLQAFPPPRSSRRGLVSLRAMLSERA